MADKILNTGLDALLGDVATPNKQTIKEIELDQIKPNRFQPRQSFDQQKIKRSSRYKVGCDHQSGGLRDVYNGSRTSPGTEREQWGLSLAPP